MARPSHHGSYVGHNGNHYSRYAHEGAGPTEVAAMHDEIAQLRQLCADLEQALNEATQQAGEMEACTERFREYEALLESKDETIRQMHAQLQEAREAVEQAASTPSRKSGPLPREDELLRLSEDLEAERRQLEEDEQALMEQMRQMEIGMARERAEMARQRNDLQRLSGEIRHELERLERNGAIQTKMDELKAKLQDATNRRGAAPAQSSSSVAPAVPAQPPAAAPAQPRGSFMGRLFGGK